VNWLLAVSGGFPLLRMDVTSLFNWDGDSYPQDEGEDKLSLIILTLSLLGSPWDFVRLFLCLALPCDPASSTSLLS
jgi:hypothetical protein